MEDIGQSVYLIFFVIRRTLGSVVQWISAGCLGPCPRKYGSLLRLPLGGSSYFAVLGQNVQVRPVGNGQVHLGPSPSKLFGHESAFHTFSPNSGGAFRQFLLPLLLLTLVAKARIVTERSLAKPADFSIMFA